MLNYCFLTISGWHSLELSATLLSDLIYGDHVPLMPGMVRHPCRGALGISYLVLFPGAPSAWHSLSWNNSEMTTSGQERFWIPGEMRRKQMMADSHEEESSTNCSGERLHTCEKLRVRIWRSVHSVLQTAVYKLHRNRNNFWIKNLLPGLSLPKEGRGLSSTGRSAGLRTDSGARLPPV